MQSLACLGYSHKCVCMCRIISHLEHLAEIYLAQTSDVGNADLFYGLTRALDMNADKMVVEFTFVKQLVYRAVRSEGNL